ncbi:cysteine dioxygenase [Paenibacillus antri]|uniref:Cysteine dioxygenase n=1 Tax=Paenibacillus antri TaxID=2582848 RepID=A0A5R9G9S9_9BACL|nr:cysteine dioxygenase family protein [Paenibacillus antri]TLS51116.1 cysteine dioxygenase [Paenibacillus antri]
MELSDCIQKQFSRVEVWSEETIGEALSGIPELDALVRPYVTEPDGHAYGRNVVYADERMEAIVIHLPAGARTAIHDHGVSIGCAVVVEGRMTNEVYRLDPGGRLRLAEADAHRAGERMPSPAGVIHRMRNDGDARLVSLHVYAPPLRGMTRYD